ncbi:PAS domain-containing protein [Mucilaginibacter sp. RS28]|uniref:histidine kinase n=1 Tax=Mucilaginibacter straminoryzae TaxID=2932774 RepID=A0A9X1X189_9SPHI|nr:PAS domain-containing protein [Mucilaginibacter straminoryzae]MCJ8209168.1 PAS domain-containing protein [Mucilaginibacter straminoryzae]
MKNNEKARVLHTARLMNVSENIKKDLHDIVDLAADICQTPIALITLIDDDTQWFIASRGVATDRNTREASFCKYTIVQEDLLIVNDARTDDRFKTYPVVLEAPHIKFYAGANLTTRDGYNAGTLCVLDVEPKDLTEAQRNSLKILSRQVVNLMELSLSLESLEVKHEETLEQKKLIEAADIQLKAFFNTSKDIFILIDTDMRVIAHNRSAERFIYRVTGKHLYAGDLVTSYLDKLSNKIIVQEFRKAVKGSDAIKEWKLMSPGKQLTWMETYFMPVVRNEQVIGVAINASDITVRKFGEEELRLKNEALQRIALMQSHEIRRPVASLMGILELLKVEYESPEKLFPYFDMIEQSVLELDAKICDVVSKSEFTLNIKASLF